MARLSNVSLLKHILTLGLIAIAGGGGYVLWRQWTVDPVVEELIFENTELRRAIANLTDETQIGYAKVIEQTSHDGVLTTRLLFVETDPKDITRRVLQKEFEIEGDIVHFDALIVKFTAPMVMEGREKAMYLWRRVYGETMRPEDGQPIHTPYTEPARYRAISEKLSLQQREQFWHEIWDLSNDPHKLEDMGIQAIFGNVVYKRLRPGLIYIFKINPAGAIYPEMIPEL
ncbi:MAG TPA: hypothetical protein ENN97_07645 [Phycisphaerales bacterium]|nr:hypothetical protein [Phycisphaerales bacterium]